MISFIGIKVTQKQLSDMFISLKNHLQAKSTVEFIVFFSEHR